MQKKSILLTLIAVTCIGLMNCKKIEPVEKQKYNTENKILKSIINSSARNAGIIDWEEVYKEVNENVAGLFGLSAYRTPFTDYGSGRFQGFFRTSFVTDGLDVQVDNNDAPEEDVANHYLLFDDGIILPLFGNSVNIDLGYKIGSQTHLYQTNIALPQSLEVNEGDLTQIDGTVENNATIEWTEDESDVDTYIVLTISYDPGNLNNTQISGHEEMITRSFLLADNGSFTFTNNEVDPFPHNSFVEVNLYRIHFGIETHSQTQKDFAFGSYTSVMMTGWINK